MGGPPSSQSEGQHRGGEDGEDNPIRPGPGEESEEDDAEHDE